MKRKLFCSFIFSFLLAVQVASQEKNKIKFGDVSGKDFATKVYSIDSNAHAVVIADIGSSNIEGNNKSWFSLVYKHFKRVHILNKNGYDIANVSISLYSDDDGDEEQLDKLRAVTYNLENGKVVETKLDVKNNVFKDKISKNRITKKFTFPNVKEGSIIEYEYVIVSDFLSNLHPWEFQGAYPRLWSEYNLSVPSFLGYVFLTQGYKAYDIKNKEQHSEVFNIADSRGTGATERFSFTAYVEDYRWVIKNVPALKEENYTSTIDNHITKIEFQLSEYRDPLRYRNIMGTWPKLTEGLMNADFFGQQVTKDNGWLKDIIAPLINGSAGKADRANKIFAYVRDNFTCTSHDRFSMDQTLKGLVKTHNGNVAEINLLLTAMLKYADIEADPVILSTRTNGYTFPMYPLLSKFNYVICRAAIDNKTFFLDASEPHIGFGRLPLRCYNGHARVVNKEAEAIELNNDEITETKITTLFIINDEKGNLIGSVQQTPGYYESIQLRKRVKEKGPEQLQNDIRKDFGADIVISNFLIDSLDKFENELGIHYDFDIKDEKEDIIYFNPLFGEGYKENPFKSAERFYPVEMPFAIDETVNLQMGVPQGYVVDELPKSIVVKMNEQEDGMFEYRISQSGDNISLRSRIRFKRCFFMPDEYEILREFFNLIVKKQAEQIVFKKKK